MLALVLLGVVFLSSASTAATSVATPGISVIRISSSASWSTSILPNYASVVLGVGSYSLISGIKLASPTTTVTGYKSAVEMTDDCGTYYDTCLSGITYQQALAHDASYPADPWVLRDASGNSITAPAYPHAHLANVGSASYQRQWLTNVAGAEKRLGFDGAYIDSVLGQISGWSGGVMPTLYPTDTAWEGAMKSFMAYVGPALKAQGLYVRANAYKGGDNDGSADIAWWQAIAPYVNGLQAEYFEQAAAGTLYNNDPCCWTGHWEHWLGLAAAAQNAGADFFAGMKGSATDTGKMMYGKASFLLVWDGSGGGFFWQTTDGSSPWNTAYTTNVGAPSGARYQVGVGWRRDYTGGTVLVNPHWSSAQTFSLGGTYLNPSGTAVSSVTLAPTSAMILTTQSATLALAAPTNLTLPTISGTAQSGSTLTASPGTWSGSPTSYAYQWKRCDSSGANCVGVATGTSYLVAAADVGSTIRVTVTASNSAGSVSATSAPTALVSAATAPPTNLTLPTISGTAQSGSTLTASPGTWSGSPTTYYYYWRRCNTYGNSCATVTGGVGATTYLLSTADVGYTIRVEVFARNSAGTTNQNSDPTAIVQAAATSTVPPVNLTLPTISGTPKVGQTLAATAGTWSGSPTTYFYYWRRCNRGGNACATVTGGIGATTYLLSTADVGFTIRVEVFAQNSAGTTNQNSNQTAVVQ